MRFVILGAGAIGCYVGGRLAVAGQDVTLVGRPRVIEHLAVNGLTVSDLDGFKAHLEAASLQLALSLGEALGAKPGADESGGPLVILLCVKGGASESAAREIAQACPSGTTVVSLQNGVDNVGRIATNASHMKVLAGMVPYNVVMANPTHVHRATTGSLVMARSAVSEQMLPAFNAAGLPLELVDDMRAVQWGKLLLNLNNPVNALSDLPLQAQLLDRDLRGLLADLQSEALVALAAAGIKPAKVAAVSPRALPQLLRLPNWIFKRLAARMLRIDATARSSMADDLRAGRVTEIDDLCGAVVRLARASRCSAPMNQAMCHLVAAHRPGHPMSGQDIRQAMKHRA